MTIMKAHLPVLVNDIRILHVYDLLRGFNFDQVKH